MTQTNPETPQNGDDAGMDFDPVAATTYIGGILHEGLLSSDEFFFSSTEIASTEIAAQEPRYTDELPVTAEVFPSLLELFTIEEAMAPPREDPVAAATYIGGILHEGVLSV